MTFGTGQRVEVVGERSARALFDASLRETYVRRWLRDELHMEECDIERAVAAAKLPGAPEAKRRRPA